MRRRQEASTTWFPALVKVKSLDPLHDGGLIGTHVPSLSPARVLRHCNNSHVHALPTLSLTWSTLCARPLTLLSPWAASRVQVEAQAAVSLVQSLLSLVLLLLSLPS